MLGHRLVRPYEHLNMCQISSFTAAAEGPVAKFWSFASFEEKKEIKPFDVIYENSYPIRFFGQIKNSFFCFCRPILDIFGFTLLK